MGLLGDIYSFGNRAKRAAKGLLSDPIGTVQQSVGELTDNVKEYNRLNKIAWESKDPVAQRQAEDQVNQMSLNGLLNFAPIGMTVWHGSPHKFSKFDMSKIGTGEGAQAYGHGLYMAEAPEVAQGYAKSLTDGRILGAKSYLRKYNGDADAGIAAARKEIDRLQSLKLTPETGSAKRDSLIANQERQIAELTAYKEQGILSQEQLYKVDIPDEAVSRFLDWDKPLSQQAPEVQKILQEKALQDRMAHYTLTPEEMLSGSGKNMYEMLGDSPAAAEILKKNGIQGIRYLDGGSRSAGQGSSNFVLFDDQLPRILETNGVPTGLQPWQPGEWQGLLR